MNAEQNNPVPRVLIADASRSNRVMLRKRLELHGYHCVTAETGNQVLCTLREFPSLMVLLDMRFSDMDGQQLIRQINRQMASQRPVIIAVTARTMAGDREKILECGCDAYIPKPIDMNKLITTMDEKMVTGDRQRLIA